VAHNRKLSSECLYHYTKELSSLKGILTSGFRFHLIKEELSYKGKLITQDKFAICFCDITNEDSASHRLEFGQYGIALTKEWGMKHGVSPVRYSHEWSPGNGDAYRALKSMYFSATQESPECLSSRNLLWAAKIRAVADEGKNGQPLQAPLYSDEGFKNREKYLEELRQVATIPNEKDNQLVLTFRHTFESLMWYIQCLHNEFELRDMYIRRFEKYDEREWRAIYVSNFDEPPFMEMMGEKEMRLKDSYNLKFEASDIHELLVVNEAQKADLSKFLRDQRRESLISRLKII
jgi:hypothetical protein